jgi:hypothetical protein
MTDAEKIEQVEQALDGTRELIARAREVFREGFSDDFMGIFFGCGTDHREFRDAEIELVRVVGERKADRIIREEETKFVKKLDPEEQLAWGDTGERDGLPVNRPEDLDEWIADRKHQKNRREYARKFYGVKP